MQALVEQAKGYEMVLVASNKPHAAGLDWAIKLARRPTIGTS